MTLTKQEVCARAPDNSISSFNSIRLPRISSNSDNSRSNHKASQNAGSLATTRCCFVPMIMRYWLHSWQSQHSHLRDSRTSFGYSTRKLKSSPSPNTFLRATNSFGRHDTRVTFWTKTCCDKTNTPTVKVMTSETLLQLCRKMQKI
jgi:hypothetical protein